jgi:hypothetical protein
VSTQVGTIAHVGMYGCITSLTAGWLSTGFWDNERLARVEGRRQGAGMEGAVVGQQHAGHA